MTYKLDGVPLGLWIDNPKSHVLKPEFFQWFAETLNFDLMLVMIDRMDRDPSFYYTAKQVERLLKLADPYGIEIVLTTWPYPDKQQLIAQGRQMDELLCVGPVGGWETDQEFNWKPSMVRGFGPRRGEQGRIIQDGYDVAGDYLVKLKKDLCAKHGARNIMTTFGQHREASSRADTAQHMDELMIQAYAVSERNGRPVDYDHPRYGPGPMQKMTFKRLSKLPKGKGVKIGVGHAAWSQRFRQGNRRVDPVDAMRDSFEASLPFHPVAHAWWSCKFAYPRSRRYNRYSEAFLRTLRPVE